MAPKHWNKQVRGATLSEGKTQFIKYGGNDVLLLGFLKPMTTVLIRNLPLRRY
jgi:hypothetical protein